MQNLLKLLKHERKGRALIGSEAICMFFLTIYFQKGKEQVEHGRGVERLEYIIHKPALIDLPSFCIYRKEQLQLGQGRITWATRKEFDWWST